MVRLVHEQFAEDEITGKAHDIEQNCEKSRSASVSDRASEVEKPPSLLRIAFLLLDLCATPRNDIARQPRQSGANAQRNAMSMVL
ncbi:hypothetical protein [Tunturiibacter gelidiferens]|uniref:hypothetical protein n=1 Tax=Tunturiibacter gelidiferens TaxID=3069689 RepID=UPI003D9B8644